MHDLHRIFQRKCQPGGRGSTDHQDQEISTWNTDTIPEKSKLQIQEIEFSKSKLSHTDIMEQKLIEEITVSEECNWPDISTYRKTGVGVQGNKWKAGHYVSGGESKRWWGFVTKDY